MPMRKMPQSMMTKSETKMTLESKRNPATSSVRSVYWATMKKRTSLSPDVPCPR